MSHRIFQNAGSVGRTTAVRMCLLTLPLIIAQPSLAEVQEAQVFAGSSSVSGWVATQSSTLPGYPTAGAGSAVDGNTDGNFFNGSVTATNLDSNAWWQVDLGTSTAMSSIVVWNRTDCCGFRLANYWVFVSDTPFLATDTPLTLVNRPNTFSSFQAAAPNPSTTIAAATQGRYLRIQLSTPNYLSLAEVQVFGSESKMATQSSTLPGAPTAGPMSAMDGNTDGDFFDGSVTATNLDSNAWWQVDLGSSTTLGSVVIWNRTDCCGSRLNDYWVFVSDTPFLPTDTPATLQFRAGTFSSHQTTTPNPSATITGMTQGRYVRVQLTGTNYLSLAEVQVFGPSNLSQGQAATQSSTLPGYPTAGAGSAVDGNTDGNFFNGSVTATNLDSNPWWQVDLGVSANISNIIIWNRTDCCGTRLNDFWVFVSDTPFLASDTPATLQFRAGTFARHITAAPSPYTSIGGAAQGRYVRVQLAGANYLSLAEVQVIGLPIISSVPPSTFTFGAGTYLVGKDLPAGRYYTVPAVGGGCYWERLSGLGGSFGEIIANDFIGAGFAQAIVEIAASDLAFSTEVDCGTWHTTPRLGSQSSIPSGTWLVGAQIAPGTYQANAQYGCYWERLRNFGGNSSAIIANEFVSSAGNQLVSIAASDVGFSTASECGTWTRVSNQVVTSQSAETPAEVKQNWLVKRSKDVRLQIPLSER